MTHETLRVSDEASGFVYLEDGAGKKVLTVYGCSAVKIERAHRLALCWNTHDGLLFALEEAEAIVRALHDTFPDVVPPLILARIQAKIKAAKE